ncbi:unnamed protein product, partial [marine sediment metagenome]
MARQKSTGAGGKKCISIFSYFTCLGLGFMLIEISLIQKYILFLGHPTYSFSFLLCYILLCAGMGSFYANRFSEENAGTSLKKILLLLIIFTAVYISLEKMLLSAFLKNPLLIKAML